MNTETILADEAAYIAKNMQGGVPALEAELREIEERKIEIDAKLNAAKSRKSTFSISAPASNGISSARVVGFNMKRDLRWWRCPVPVLMTFSDATLAERTISSRPDENSN